MLLSQSAGQPERPLAKGSFWELTVTLALQAACGVSIAPTFCFLWIGPSTTPCGTITPVSANKVHMSPINTSSVTTCTKEEDGGLDGDHLGEAKSASKFPLLLAKIFFRKNSALF